MDRLKVIGPFKGWSGYDRHTRAFVRQFIRLGTQVQLINLDGWSIALPPEQREGHFFDTLSADVSADTVLHFTMPNHARPERDKHNVNYTMFEANGIPAAWVARAVPQELIVVPTESSRQAWINSGVPPEKVCISPLGVDGDFFAQKVDPLPLIDLRQRPVSTYRTRFLNIAELRPRKNHLGLLRSWMRATHPKDDAILIVKMTLFQPRAISQFQADFAEMQTKTGLSLEDAAPVLFIAHVLSDEEIRALYQTATHYISMSKGEGWDQVMMEAAVSGLRLIAPAHSAYTHYLTEDDTEFIPSNLTAATFEGQMGYEDYMFFNGLHWWEPDEDAAVSIIQRIIRNATASKPSPQHRIINQYSWENAAQKLLNILKALQ